MEPKKELWATVEIDAAHVHLTVDSFEGRIVLDATGMVASLTAADLDAAMNLIDLAREAAISRRWGPYKLPATPDGWYWQIDYRFPMLCRRGDPSGLYVDSYGRFRGGVELAHNRPEVHACLLQEYRQRTTVGRMIRLVATS